MNTPHIALAVMMVWSSGAWASVTVPSQEATSKLVYLEQAPREPIILQFYAETNCANDAVRVDSFDSVKEYKDADSGKDSPVHLRFVYAGLARDSAACAGERKEKLLKTLEFKPEPTRMTHLWITFDGTLILKRGR